jgi:hypothetical protein
MNRRAAGSFAALILLVTATASADAAPNRATLVEQMKQSCFSNHANDDPAVKAKCECYAQHFVDSLTPGEIAVPKPSAEIQAKLRAARMACKFGEF